MVYLICNQGKESDKMITRNHKNIMKYANIITFKILQKQLNKLKVKLKVQ